MGVAFCPSLVIDCAAVDTPVPSKVSALVQIGTQHFGLDLDVMDCERGCACIPVWRWVGTPPMCPSCNELLLDINQKTVRTIRPYPDEEYVECQTCWWRSGALCWPPLRRG